MFICEMFCFVFSGNRLLNGDKYLYDGVLWGQFDDYLITPYTAKSRRARTLMERIRDQRIRADRVVVEHYFARVKVYFPIVANYKFKRDVAGYIVRTCAMLTNIILLFQCPLRHVPCSASKKCFVCTHMPNDLFAVHLAHRMSSDERLAEVVDTSLHRRDQLDYAVLEEGRFFQGTEYELDEVDRNY